MTVGFFLSKLCLINGNAGKKVAYAMTRDKCVHCTLNDVLFMMFAVCVGGRRR